MAMPDQQDRPVFHAGFPNAAAEAVDIPLDLNQLVVRHPTSTFYMRAGSQSWETLGVNKGDILVIDRSLEPKANDLVVVTDGEDFGLATIPPDNQTKDEELTVWGVIIWVIQQRRKGGK